MLSVKMICVGRMREKFYIDAFNEYSKRLQPYCKLQLLEPTEQKLGDCPSQKELEKALDREAEDILSAIPSDSYVVALCIEGRELSSEALAELVARVEGSGRPRMCFVIGGSYGLSPKVKARADLKLSMSTMTFPHHLARVMLSEQLYRSFKINEGSRYHK